MSVKYLTLDLALTIHHSINDSYCQRHCCTYTCQNPMTSSNYSPMAIWRCLFKAKSYQFLQTVITHFSWSAICHSSQKGWKGEKECRFIPSSVFWPFEPLLAWWNFQKTELLSKRWSKSKSKLGFWEEASLGTEKETKNFLTSYNYLELSRRVGLSHTSIVKYPKV